MKPQKCIKEHKKNNKPIFVITLLIGRGGGRGLAGKNHKVYTHFNFMLNCSLKKGICFLT